MNKKLFQIVDKIISALEHDKFSLIILITILIGMILVAIGLSTTKANYTPHTVKNTKQVWGYQWGNKAITLQKKLINIWYTDYASKLIINKCKKFRTTWVVDCIIAVASIWKAESNMFRNCYHNNCMWMYDGWVWYKSISAWLDDFMIRYNKYWYNWKRKWWASFFYPYNWHLPLSRYCLAKTNYGWLNFHKTFKYLIK